MNNHIQFSKTDLVPRPNKGKLNLFFGRDGKARVVPPFGPVQDLGIELGNEIPENSLFASATLEPTGDDNDILVTAKTPGIAGNALTAEIVIEEDSVALTVEEANGDVVVTSGDKRRMIVTADFGDGVETVSLQNTGPTNWAFEASGNVSYALYSNENDGAGLTKFVDSVAVAEFGGSHPGSGWADDVNDWSAVVGTATGTPTVTAAPATTTQVIDDINGNQSLSVSADNADGSDGSGAVGAVAQTSLSVGAGEIAPPHIRINNGVLYVYDSTLSEWRQLSTASLD